GDVELLSRSTSLRQDGESHGVPDLVRTDGSDEPHASVNESIIDLAHHVPLLQPSLVRRASGVHLHDLSSDVAAGGVDLRADQRVDGLTVVDQLLGDTHRLVGWDGEAQADRAGGTSSARSEEHTSELQSRFELVCRLRLETKK